MNPNDPQLKDFLGRLQQVSLSDAARSRIENNLREYAAFHSVRVAEASRLIKQVPVIGPVINFIKRPRIFMPALLITLMLIAGGGTSLAAQGALPGDFLYPIKIDINEEVVSALALSDEAEASLQAKLAKERLEEAETLAANGKLTAELATEVSTNLKSHQEKAEALSAKLEAKGDLKTSGNIRSTIEGTFRSYADVLSNLNANVSGNNGVSLISDIHTYLNAHDDRTTASSSVELSADLKASISDTIEYADTAIARAEVSLKKVEGNVNAGVYAQMQAKLAAAVAANASATTAITAKHYTEAYADARTAIRLATQVQTKAASAAHLQSQVKAGLNLDSIIKLDADEKDGAQEPKKTTPSAKEPNEVENSTDEEKPHKDTRNVEGSVNTNKETDDGSLDVNTSLNGTLGL